MAASRSRTRPLWRTLVDALTFAMVLVMVSLALDYFEIMDLQPGKVRVIDGDSLRKGDLEIRLFGIDAPEAKQSCNDGRGVAYQCGVEARKSLQQLVAGKELKCKKRDVDRYGRTVAVCEVNGVEINREMVRLGWAIAYDKHSFALCFSRTRCAQEPARHFVRGISEPEDYRERKKRVEGALVETSFNRRLTGS